MAALPVRRWQTWIALFLVGFILCVALFAPFIAPPEDKANPGSMKVVGSGKDFVPHPPSSDALLGTSYFQKNQYDIFYTLVWGTGEALRFGVGVTLISALFGAAIGVACAFRGGVMNFLFIRVTNAFLAFPLMAAIAFMTMLWGFVFTRMYSVDLVSQIATGGGETVQVATEGISFFIQVFFTLFMRVRPFALAVLLLAWIPYARLINDQILRLKNTDFIFAARSLGARKARIVLRHLIPNSMTPIIVWATKSVGGLVILQATFTYIGLGGGGSSWARLLNFGKNWIIGPGGDLLAHWWVYFPITFAIVLFGFAWNLLGDELNIILNPRERW